MTSTEKPEKSSPKTIGVVSEALVFARLVELGYGVSLPFGDNLRYDMVVDDGQSLTRVQVKTGRLRHGSVVFAAQSINWHSKQERDYRGQADDFLVYCPDTNEIYRVPVDDCGSARQVSLRVGTPDGTSGRPALRWAAEHLFNESAWITKLNPLPACARIHPDTPSRIVETHRGGVRRRHCRECSRVASRRTRGNDSY